MLGFSIFSASKIVSSASFLDKSIAKTRDFVLSSLAVFESFSSFEAISHISSYSSSSINLVRASPIPLEAPLIKAIFIFTSQLLL